MTPAEKAIELLTKYRRHLPINTVTDLEAKGCALMAVDEIFEEFDHIPFDDNEYGTYKMKYWQEVKQEIEKL